MSTIDSFPAVMPQGALLSRRESGEHREQLVRAAAARPKNYRIGVIDDDLHMRDALGLLLRSAGFAVEMYGCAEDYLKCRPDPAAAPDCLLLDMRMTGLDGLSLQKTLVADGHTTPIIFITAHANVAMVVRAVKLGAFDVLEKPFHRETLLEKLAAALERGVDRRGQQSRGTAIMALTVLLSAREREVYDLLLAAKTTKEIAAELDISQKTVAKHRVRILGKLRVDSVLELVRAVSTINEARQVWPREPLPR